MGAIINELRPSEVLRPRAAGFDGVPGLLLEDETIIARASSGLALCGTSVGSSTEGNRAFKQLLLPPKECMLKGPDQASKMETLSFSSIHSSKNFCEHVEKSWWSLAVSGSSPWGFSMSGSGGSDKNIKVHKQEENRMSSEACQMQCWYFPKASFSIPRHQMRLTEEALEDVRRVRTLQDADWFLHNYNSHVSSGRYHLGGVLLKGVTIKVQKETSVESLLETVATSLNGKFEFDSLKASSKVVYMIEHSSSSIEEKSSQQATMETFITALGPQISNVEEFKAGLEDKSTWHIIDMPGDEANLVPIWEVIQFEDAKLDLQLPCNLIREAWQRSIPSEAHKDTRRFQLFQSASNTSFARRSNFVNKDEAVGRLKSRLAAIPDFRDLKQSPPSPVVLKDLLSKVWTEATQLVDPYTSEWDNRQLLFELPEFDNLLLMMVKSTEIDMEERKRFIRQIINKDTLRLLQEAGVSLRESVKTLLQSPTQVDVFTTPFISLENISPAALLERLKILVGDDGSHEGQLAMPTAGLFIVDVERAIKACLQQDTNQSVKSIILNHGFNGNGDYYYVEDAAKEQVLIINQELESSMKDEDAPNRTLQVQEATTPKSFPAAPQYTIPPEDIFTLNGDVLVDRPLKTLPEHPFRNMIDCIRHRIEPFTSAASNPRTNGFLSIFKGADESNNIQEKPIADSSAIKILVELLKGSDLLAQIALFHLLLEQRYSVPLIVPKDTCLTHPRSQKAKGFGHLAEALNFVQVKLENQEILLVVEDIKLPRVVFVSNRKIAVTRETVEMARNVLNCQFLSKHSKRAIEDDFTVVELGVGFIKTSNDGLRKHRPCLAFSVWGDHNQVEDFLMQVADVVIIELDPSEDVSSHQRPIKKWNDVLYWSINPSEMKYKKVDEKITQICGSFSNMALAISKYLEESFDTWSSKSANYHSATLIDCLRGTDPSLNKILPKFSGAALNFEKARASFELQKSFNLEADIYFKSLNQKGKDFSREMKKFEEERILALDKVQDLPILQHFVHLLSEEHYLKRRIGIMQFQLAIDKEFQSTLEQASKLEEGFFKEHQQYPNDRILKEQYYLAKKTRVDQMLGLEHVWRELSHIFTAVPSRLELPKLAAHYLLDGFPLEILDGDAAKFQKIWMETVLVQLNSVLHESLGHTPKIFVLSVVGLQSSGKSTLLNLMFGTQFRTSAGQCTRGVYLQLVKSEWQEFDYVLLLDTQGIRSPEYHGCQDAEIKDNRLATFAVLPADACIIMVANEEDNGLKEVLPMVLLAFKGSAMAERSAGRMQAKLFFVYRSIDTNDVKKLRMNQRKLQEELREASSEISNMRICGPRQKNPNADALSSTSLSINPLSNFNVDEQEENSDVKYLGNLKKGNTPPLDVSDFEYGEKVVELRKYIHKRVLDKGQWAAHELKNWTEYLGMVWQCIADSNFELGFLNLVEHSHYQDLQTELASCRNIVGRKCLEEAESTEQKLLNLPRGIGHAELRNSFINKVKDILIKEGEVVQAILEQREWQRWKVGESTKWMKFCLEQEKDNKGRLQDCIDGVLQFDNVVKEYCNRIQRQVESEAEKYVNTVCTLQDREKSMKREFDVLFRAALHEASEKNPPKAIKIPGRVHDMYQQRSVVGEKYKFDKNSRDQDLRDRSNSSFKGAVLDTMKEKIANFFKGDESPSVRQVIKELIPKVEKHLEHVKQYTDHIVEEKIRFSEESMKHKVENKEDAKTVHNCVKRLLSSRLEHIQQEWDKTHNVAKRLEKEQSRLQQFFESCANRVGEMRKFSSDLSKLLQSALKDSFKSLVARRVVNNTQSEAWVGNWKVMRAYLDLHLVKLIEDKNTEELIFSVSDGSSHYKSVLNNLIEENIRNELTTDFQKRCVVSIKHAIHLAAVSAKDSSSLPRFLKSLTSDITHLKFLELSKSIGYVELYAQYGNHIDFFEVERQVCTEIDFSEYIATIEELGDIVCLVKDRMIASQNESARLRCEEKCPHCKLTCFLAAGHDNRHNTLHQPAGLAGVCIVDKSCHDLKGERVWRSCSQSVMDESGRSFYPNIKRTETVLYKDFSKNYPEWALPSEGFGTVKGREYIFAHYQDERVRKSGGRKCTEIPKEYYHDVRGLRRELENVLQRHESHTPDG